MKELECFGYNRVRIRCNKVHGKNARLVLSVGGCGCFSSATAAV